MRFGNNGIKIFVILTTLVVSNACTLRKRAQANGDKPQDKVTIETPTPSPTAMPTAIPSGTPTPQGSQQPFSGTPAGGNFPTTQDPQTQLDFEEFKNPTYNEVNQEEFEAETSAPSRKRFTGHTDEMGRPYTDAGIDFLVPYLRLRQNQTPETPIKRNSLELAHRISDVKLIDTSGSQFSARVTLMLTNKQPLILKLTGPAKQGGRYALLSPRESGSLKQSPQAPFQAEIRCVDLNFIEECSTYLMRFAHKQAEGEAVAEIVLRNTTSTLRIRLPKVVSSDTRIRELKEVFVNSALKYPKGRHFDTFEIQSYAVVNGKAAFQVRMMTNQGEYLFFSGPLVSAFGNGPIKVNLNRNPDKMDPSNASWAPMSTSSLSPLIDSAQLINNNGHGMLRIDLTLNDKFSQEPISFTLTFTRHSVPVLDLNQDSIYFQP